MRVLIITFIIILIMTNTLFADGIQPEGSGTQVDPYQFATLDNLLWLSTYNDSDSMYCIQIADINAAETRTWNDGLGFLPIGCYITNTFTGHYDGQDHIIDSLYINRPEQYWIGLFGQIQDGSVRNVYLINCECTGSGTVGGVAGSVWSSVVDNCHFSGSVTGYSDTGGLLGEVHYTTVTGCSFEGFVTGLEMEGEDTVRTGGLIASTQHTSVSDCHANCEVRGEIMVGGLIAQVISSSTFTDCSVTGSVTGVEYVGGACGFCYHDWSNIHVNADVQGETWVGGFAGLAFGVEFENCAAQGDVTGEIRVGGLVGYLCNWSEIRRCSYSGEIKSVDYTGGIVGECLESSIMDTSADVEIYSEQNLTGGIVGYGTYSTMILGCFTRGSILSDGNSVGGIIGWSYRYCSVENCYNFASVTGNERVGGIAGRNLHESYVKNCYSIGEVAGNDEVGGLIGVCADDLVENSFWNTETSGQSESDGGTGLTTSEMQSSAVYTDAGWDFVGETENGEEDIWQWDGVNNDAYPYLAWEGYADTSDDEVIPEIASLALSNHPNPFNPTTTISFSIPTDDKVVLKVYNIKGQLVKTLVNDHLEAGTHKAVWNGDNQSGKNVSSGIYLYRLESCGKSKAQKMLLLK